MWGGAQHEHGGGRAYLLLSASDVTQSRDVSGGHNFPVPRKWYVTTGSPMCNVWGHHPRWEMRVSTHTSGPIP
eukprot:175188-Prymnesium_polylepis.1